MPNIGEVFKAEISRLSRKVVRQHVGPLQSASSGQRKQLAALTRQVRQLEHELTALRRMLEKNAAAPVSEDSASPRFSAKGFRSLRNRLGLSAAELGRLIGVGAQTVYNWENGKTSPRAAQVAVVAGLRKIGKREAHSRLESAPPVEASAAGAD